ncbi:putative protease Do-like 14 [Capsicum baccatum]|uniref:Protease Do-like 14 n=1 Tax=Capsicum baccatum TaxID=33114 RepID=A0A2G2WNG0_CAPBA|nr:putative protease Do-like 14 [Capsicum baccatum]
MFPSCFARRIGLDSPGNVRKEGSGEDDDDGEKKHKCCNCFGRDTIANAAATVGPAVVNISVSRSFHGLRAGRSIGSGTIKDADGTILTCAHVVDFQGLSISSKGKIKSTTLLPTAKLGTSNKRLRPGDWVVAMGCLQNTITAGIEILEDL